MKTNQPRLIEEITLEHGCSGMIYEMPHLSPYRYNFIIWGPPTHEKDLAILHALRMGACNDLEMIRQCLPDWAEDAFYGRNPRELDIH